MPLTRDGDKCNPYKDPFWGTFKRDKQTFANRIKDAEDKGQLNKAARIKRRRDNHKRLKFHKINESQRQTIGNRIKNK